MYNPAVKLWMRYLWYVPLVGIAALLISTFRLYASSEFWLDDLTSLYWVQKTSGADMLIALLDPATPYFRPAGMVFYWIGLRMFGTNALPYHELAWIIHTVNTTLVYMVLARITASRQGAAVGAMLFASPAVFTDIFWNLGTIFELVSGCLFFLGVLLWSSERRTWARVFLLSVVFIYAVKGKEMAMTLPAIWLFYDLVVRTTSKWRHVIQIVVPGSAAVFLTYKALAEGRAVASDAPYFMDISSMTMGRGFGVYFNMILDTGIRWQVWAIGFVFLLILMTLFKLHSALFFHSWIFITFLPVIFLSNHRASVYWYIPFVGVCGIAALLVREVVRRLQPRIPSEAAAIAGSVCFLALCQAAFAVHKSQTVEIRGWQREREVESRALIQGLKELAPLPPNEILYFAVAPSHFAEVHLTGAAQVTLRRQDITAKLVEQFPEGARYRLRFENSRLYRATEN